MVNRHDLYDLDSHVRHFFRLVNCCGETRNEYVSRWRRSKLIFLYPRKFVGHEITILLSLVSGTKRQFDFDVRPRVFARWHNDKTTVRVSKNCRTVLYVFIGDEWTQPVNRSPRFWRKCKRSSYPRFNTFGFRRRMIVDVHETSRNGRGVLQIHTDV